MDKYLNILQFIIGWDHKPQATSHKPNPKSQTRTPPQEKYPELKDFTNENNHRLHTTDYKPYPTDHQLQATSQNPQATSHKLITKTMPKSVQNLEIWQDAMSLVKDLYRLTTDWPKEETYGLTDQVRRAAVSVPANLAEGVGRGSPKEMARFAKISRGSLYELDTLLELAAELGYIESEDLESLKEKITSLSKRTSGFIKYQENNSE